MGSRLGVGRNVLSVVAPHSGSGKTAFVTHLIPHIPGLGCLKVSPAHDWPERSTFDEQAGGAGYFTEDTDRSHRAGTDTASFLAAGAACVERLRHRSGGLRLGLAAALKKFPPGMPVAVESSSAVRLVSPVCVVMVVRPPIREMKPTSHDVLPVVTDLLLNASDRMDSDAEAERLVKEFPGLRPTHTWSCDLSLEPPPIDMLRRLRGLLCGQPTTC